MTHTINGHSHKALKFFRQHPAALPVLWDYMARANDDNVAWPSVIGLAEDTGWSRSECFQARVWLVEHGALIEIEDYIRPLWRKLSPQKLAQKRNFDRAKYYRATGVLVIDDKSYEVLYATNGQEAETGVDKNLADEPQDNTDVPQGSTSGPCTTGADISPRGTELNTIQENTQDDTNGIDAPAAINTATLKKPERKRDPLYDAIAELWFDAKRDTPKFQTLGGRIGLHVKWCKGDAITVKRKDDGGHVVKVEIDGCKTPLTPGLLHYAHRDWYREHPDIHHPTDILKFIDWIDTWLGKQTTRPAAIITSTPAERNRDIQTFLLGEVVS